MSEENKFNFTALDFETANGKYESICQVGLVRIEGGVIVKEIDLLVQPPDNTYHWGHSRVHGIKSRDTVSAPTFDKIWHHIEPYVFRKKIVAHNALFDTRCLRQVLKFYQLDIPPFDSECTVKIYNKNLAALCQEHGIEINHHHALSDAKACAELYLKHLHGMN